ncbi:MAG: ester cyclase [Candidatus Thorarchaeota archaeon]
MKVLAERSLQIWNEGNLNLVDELYASNCIRHEVDISEDLIGTEAYKEYVTFLRTAYPDFNVIADELIIKDDKMVTRWTLTGTNTGPRGEMPPTGNKTKISGVNVNKIVEGKTVEEWVYYNNASVLTQLGFTITPPAQEGEPPEEQAEE